MREKQLRQQKQIPIRRSREALSRGGTERESPLGSTGRLAGPHTEPLSTGLPCGPRSPPPGASARPRASGRGGGPREPAPARLSGPRRSAGPGSAVEREPRPPRAASPPSGQRRGGARSGGTRQRARAAQARSRKVPARRRCSSGLAPGRCTHPQPGPGSSWRAGGGSERRPCPLPPRSHRPPATYPAPHTDRPRPQPHPRNNTAP